MWVSFPPPARAPAAAAPPRPPGSRPPGGRPSTLESPGTGTIVSPCEPSVSASTRDGGVPVFQAMKARKRAVSSMPAMPTTRSGGALGAGLGGRPRRDHDDVGARRRLVARATLDQGVGAGEGKRLADIERHRL